MSEIWKLDRARLPCIRNVEKERLSIDERKVNELLKKTKLKDVTEDNDLFYVGAALVTEVFEKNKAKGEKKQPWWKRRLESQVKELNKDLGRLNALLKSKKMKKRHQDNLQRDTNCKRKENQKQMRRYCKELKWKLLHSTDTSKEWVNSNRTGFLEIMRVNFISKQMDVKKEKKL